MDVFCILKEAVHDVQEEIDGLKQENERLKATADDCGRLQTIVAELEVKLQEMQKKLVEQVSLVCLFCSCIFTITVTIY